MTVPKEVATKSMAKLIFDQRKAQEAAADEQRKEREAAADELRDRRYRFISTLVEVIYNIETAKLVLPANRSRGRIWSTTGLFPVLRVTLLAEYGNRKQALGELQLKAEEAKQ